MNFQFLLKKLFLLLIALYINLSCKAAATDTTQVLENLKVISQVLNTNVDSSKGLILKNIEDSKQLNFTKGVARSYLALTQYYIFKGQPDSAKLVIPELEKVLNKSEDISLNISILLKIAVIYSDLGDFKESINKVIQAQKMGEGIKDYRLLAKIHHDLGLIYSKRDLLEKSLDYYKQGLKFAWLSSDTFSIANLHARVGGIYSDMNIPDSGLYYNSISLKLYQAIKMKRGIGVALNNIAGAYELKKEYKKAIEFYEKALPIRKELGDEYAITIISYNLGVCYLHLNQLDVSENYLLSSLSRTKEEKDYQQVLQTLRRLTELYAKRNNASKYQMYAEEYINLKDSLTTANNIKAITELQQQYETEKKEKDIQSLKEINQKQEVLNAAQRKNRLIIIISLVLIVLLLSAFAAILYKRFKIIRSQKRLIEIQKEKVEEQKNLTEVQKSIIEVKQKEIVDSINYAKHLQQAILATPEEIKQSLPQSFLLYKPKDIVAGDFYFFEETPTHIFIAAADCTGHGVPGALVSVVCCNALTRAVKEFKLTDPAEVLTRTSDLVLTTFKKSRTDIKDGMDISFLTINKSTKSIMWAGANNPLWYFINGQLFEIKGDKQPIGFTENPTGFTTHHLPDQSAVYYLLTDGYADQFGGPKGKKFKYAQLKELFASVHQLPMEEQSKLIEESFENWRQNYEQVDDVCVMGVRV